MSDKSKRKVLVIGGGPAGLMAAIKSSENGNIVTLIEKNEKLGKKIFITGKGRCNVTNNCSEKDFISNVVSNPKFMYGPINNFSTTDLIDFFENNGLSLKTERGNRVFPSSDKAYEVTDCLKRVCVKNGVNIKLNCNVLSIKKDEDFIVETNNGTFNFDVVIICTGGISYPLTGSDGDGYKFAKNFGHKIIQPVASLVGIETKEQYIKNFQGISLKNVTITVSEGNKTLFTELGEMLFTHFGVSGPLVLSASAIINRKNFSNLIISIDFKPGISYNILDNRLIRELTSFHLKSVLNVIKTLLPSNMAETFLKICKVNPNKRCCDVTSIERNRICSTLKNFVLTPSKLRPIEEAIVTAGGVDVKEINPKTMESKLVKGLFFAGEVIDVDCFTGGFNMQTAFSTGYLAGVNT